MKIENRKRKIQSEKIVKELIMYLALLSNGIVFISELDIEDDKNSHTSLRTFQRYAKELEEASTVPSLILKKDDEGIYYYVIEKAEPKIKNTFMEHQNPFMFVVKKDDLENTYAEEFLDDYQGFNIDHEDAHIAKLARTCKLANRICKISGKVKRTLDDKKSKELTEEIYRKEINKNYNKKTFQRDIDVVVIALNEVFNGSKSDRYKEVIREYLQGYQKTS